MKAAVLHSLGEPLEIAMDIEIPALRPGQVLVRLAYSGVCHSQLMEVRGKRGPDKFLPHLLGHEGSGIVESVAPDVSKIKPGDRVILGWIKGEGRDGGGTVYNREQEQINAGGVTTFSEYSVVSENRCVPLPEDVPMDIAVLFGCAIPTGAGIVTNSIQPVDGSTIAIYGLGGIGMSALMATQLYRCEKVIAIDVEDTKLELAREFGANEVINSSRHDPVASILDLTGGRGVDYSVEAAGRTTTIEQAFKSVRNHGGRCVFASHPEHGSRISIDPYDLICGKRVEGSWGGACNPDRDTPRFAELYRAGRLPLEKLITKRYTLDHINEALVDLEQRRVGRPLIVINDKL
ncbi:MAG: zinc-binding dehydrogenase [Pseudomonadota bacterium]